MVSIPVVRGIVWDGEALVVTDDLEVRDPGYGEVWVRVAASGICHSDLNVMEGNSAPVSYTHLTLPTNREV